MAASREAHDVRESATRSLSRPFGALAAAVLVAAFALAACTPTVKLEAPDKPIVINLNVKIEQDVRVHIDEDLSKARKERPDLF
jgi:hypothetical protein